jgi:hypothetical protein
MHNAPPVAFPVGRFVWGRAVWLAMAGLGAVGLGAWQMWGQVAWSHVLWAWGFWGLCVLGAAFWVPRQTLTGGRLFWSGEAWTWQAEDGHCPVGVAEQDLMVSVGLDWGGGLLLFVRGLDVQGQGCGQWVGAWLSEGAMPSQWHGFRCAVYSRAKASHAVDGLGPERAGDGLN